MAKIISLISTKGSVGKTSLIIHIAGYLASKGKKVLLVDADSQQSLSSFFDFKGLDPDIGKNGFSLFLTGEKPANEVIYTTANHENIDIIVNDDPDKWRVSKFLRSSSGAVFKLAHLLKPLKEKYDYIFVDTEGTDGRDHDGRSVQNAALLARPDLVLSVTKPKMLFAMETSRVVDVLKAAVKEYENIGNPYHPPLKFVINEFDRHLATDKVLLSELRESFQSDPNLVTTELLQTIIPVKKKFFESNFFDKQFAHEYNDPNKHDHLNVVISNLCHELFPEIESIEEDSK